MRKITLFALVLMAFITGAAHASVSCLSECTTIIDGSSGASTDSYGSGGRPGDTPPSTGN